MIQSISPYLFTKMPVPCEWIRWPNIKSLLPHQIKENNQSCNDKKWRPTQITKIWALCLNFPSWCLSPSVLQFLVPLSLFLLLCSLCISPSSCSLNGPSFFFPVLLFLMFYNPHFWPFYHMEQAILLENKSQLLPLAVNFTKQISHWMYLNNKCSAKIKM